LSKDSFLTRIALSPDGTRLTAAESRRVGGTPPADAVTSWDVRILDVKSGRELSRLTPNTRFRLKGIHSGGRLSPDGTLLAVTTKEGVHLWDLVSGEKRSRFPPLWREEHWGVVFSADGKTMTSTEEKGAIHLWDTATGKERANRPLGDIRDICLSADGKILATSTSSGMIQIWEVAGWKERLPMLRHDGPAERLSFSPDGKRLASRERFGRTIVWDIATGRALSESRTLEWAEGCFQFTPDCRTLAVAFDTYLALCDVATGKEFPPLQGHKGAVYYVSCSPDGKVLASAGADGTIRLWDPVTRKQVRSMRNPVGEAVVAAAFAPDGRHIASWEENGTIGLWEVASGKRVRAIARGSRLELPRGGPHEPLLVSFSPDGRWLLGVSRGAVFLREVASGRPLTYFPEEELYGALSFSPDGKLLASGGPEAPVSVWEIASGKRVLQVPSPGGRWYWVTAGGFTPDGKGLAWSRYPEETTLIGDFAALLGEGRMPPPATARDLPALWDTLTGEDAREAYQAMERLAAAPREALPFLRDHLPPITPPDPRNLARLIADLDHDDFERRERATRELQKMGD
jgi:WD40 repeat protein